MKLLDTEIKKSLIKTIILIPSLIVGWLTTQIWAEMYPLIPKQLFDNIPNTLTMKFLILSMFANLLITPYLIYLIFFKKERQLPEPTISNGIYFDYLFNPLCPSCKAPLRVESISLQDQIMYRKNPKLICPNGHYDQVITDNFGTEHNFSNLRTTLIKERYDIKDDDK